MPGLSIPDDFPLHELVGQELSNLSIGRHNLILSFIQINVFIGETPKYGEGAGVRIEAGFEFQTAHGQITIAENKDLAEPAASLILLLGKSVIAVERLPNNELLLQFAAGSLKLLVDDEGYESYHLHIAGQSIDITKEW
jgi:hypothetical protein